jgi:hypothetical protein
MKFENFWSQYPKKVGKLTAKRSWEKLSLDNQQKALEAIVEHRKYWVAKGTDWEFIPHASTWINQERFEDELVIEQKENKKLSRDPNSISHSYLSKYNGLLASLFLSSRESTTSLNLFQNAKRN